MADLEKSMITLARQALDNAYAPYSKYRVASCLCSEDDTLYTGVNVENASYGLTVCAETSAICQMIAAGRKKIKSLVILSSDNLLCPPCGACRQRIVEFSTPDTLIHLCNTQNIIESMRAEELLPNTFSLKSQSGLSND
ncbi:MULTISPECIES: cytidine deaminase [unclassified Legionella]|uniref:cytidine deaminase n=1 Tax=unclassified Legionella TaxID=2622702 RepID=UPI001055C40D|nr:MULTISPECIES: cytidine deaminase [unclassified Legionella]MDI9819883.1 cytidine deaminase [Legionella sp. PL877]